MSRVPGREPRRRPRCVCGALAKPGRTACGACDAPQERLPGRRRAEEPRCGQGCGRAATVYALDPLPGGWGGRYCEPCAAALRFVVVDRL